MKFVPKIIGLAYLGCALYAICTFFNTHLTNISNAREISQETVPLFFYLLFSLAAPGLAFVYFKKFVLPLLKRLRQNPKREFRAVFGLNKKQIWIFVLSFLFIIWVTALGFCEFEDFKIRIYSKGIFESRLEEFSYFLAMLIAPLLLVFHLAGRNKITKDQ